MELASKLQAHLPFVIYKKPRSGKLHIIQQQSTDLLTDKDFQTEGFYFAPFDLQQHPVVVFPEKLSKKESYFIRSFSLPQTKIQLKKIKTESKEAEIHQNKVEKAIEYIQKGKLKKIIISRKQEIPYDKLDIYQAVLRLMHQYDNSYVYLWHHPEQGTWLGASPELLLEQQNDKLNTMALAGTLPVRKNKPVSWQMKEIAEQQIVTDYIVEKLRQFTNKVSLNQTKTIYQGNLAHIKTGINAEINTRKINAILFALHPTPAVCGIPVEKAKKIISEIEQYDRKYYTGFLGEKTKNQAFFYVNLRSLEIFSQKIAVYVGGGITIDSQKEKEWQETVEKSKILLSVLEKNYEK